MWLKARILTRNSFPIDQLDGPLKSVYVIFKVVGVVVNVNFKFIPFLNCVSAILSIPINTFGAIEKAWEYVTGIILIYSKNIIGFDGSNKVINSELLKNYWFQEQELFVSESQEAEESEAQCSWKLLLLGTISR